MRGVAFYLVIGGSAIVLTTGCAPNRPKAQFSQTIVPESRIAAKDEAKVKVEAGAGVHITESEKAELAEIIDMYITDRKITNSREGEKKTYDVNILLTRYENASAVARVLMGGLGQIHIDGEVTLLEMPERKPLGKFTISKTCAWGDTYGGIARMRDIELTFADGVAAALTGEQEEQKKKAK